MAKRPPRRPRPPPKSSLALARRREQGRERSRRARRGNASKFWVLTRHAFLEYLIDRGVLSPEEARDRKVVGERLAEVQAEYPMLRRFYDAHHKS